MMQTIFCPTSGEMVPRPAFVPAWDAIRIVEAPHVPPTPTGRLPFVSSPPFFKDSQGIICPNEKALSGTGELG